MSKPFRLLVRSSLGGLVLGLLALIGIVAMTLWLSGRAQTLFEMVIEARDARASAVELRNAMLAAESSSRGFIVTGNEIYLSPYDRSKVLADRQLAVVTALFATYEDMGPALTRLKSAIQEKFEEMDAAVALKRARKDEAVLALVRTNRGKALMDEANVFFSGLIRAADGRLTAGAAEQQANARWLGWFSIGGAVIVIMFVGAAATAAVRYTRDLQTARDEVGALNDTLEARVQDRTAALAEARDRAELLLGEVNHRVANSLALVSSLVTLQANATGDKTAKDALDETRDRIFAVAMVHKRLYSSADVKAVALDEYLGGLIDHLAQSLQSARRGVTVTHDLAAIELGTDAAINLGVVVTEWVTNAIKYAYPEGPGEIRVALRRLPDGRIELVVEDDGIGRDPARAPAGTGLGTRIVGAMAKGMKAEIFYADRGPGTRAAVILPHPAAHPP